MADLKPIPASAIPAALDKAMHYRLLNEPAEAESICLDILSTDPNHEEALVTLLLALTDQFETEFAEAFDRAKGVLSRFGSDYDREYYLGIVNERWAKAQQARGMPDEAVVSWFREAMRCYERAETLIAVNDPDPILRWNTCVRLVERLSQRQPQGSDVRRHVDVDFDEVPLR